MNRFRPIGLWADIVCVLTVAFFCSAAPALAKQCSAERPSDARTYWSYRLIDGRKCWYEGKPMLSKSLLNWPATQTAQKNAGKEPDASPASRYNPLNAQAAITDDPDTQPKPKPEIVDRSPATTPKNTLTPDDLRAWGNSKTAMAQPVLTIMDRWPDEELPQQRSTPVPAAQASSMSGRAIIMTIIVFMALSAVLLTTLRKVRSARRLPSW